MKINLAGVDVLEERRILSFEGDVMINLMNGDCLELMKTIPDRSVDMVLVYSVL